MLLHRKNDSRDASSRSLTRYGAPGVTPAGSRSTRKRNSGLTSRRRTRALDAAIERPALAPLAIERQQRLDIRRARRAAVGPRRQRREDAPGAGGLGDAPAAGTTKMRSFAGATPEPPSGSPVAFSGPSISTLRRCAPSRVSGMFTPEGYGRRNGSRGDSSSAAVRLRNVTTTSR